MDDIVNVRYLVKEVEPARDFYVKHLGFSEYGPQSPAFAAVQLGNLRLLLSGPMSSAARPMPDGSQPVPGGWNRIHLVVEDVEAVAAKLRASGVPFRNEVIKGPGGSQTVLEDPSGNPIELFQPAATPPG